MRELESCRREIDEIDAELVRLFERRMGVCRDVALYKQAHYMDILNAAREETVLKSRAQQVSDPALAQSVMALFTEIMRLSREEQRRYLEAQTQTRLIAYSGVPGAYSECAVVGFFGYTLLLAAGKEGWGWWSPLRAYLYGPPLQEGALWWQPVWLAVGAVLLVAIGLPIFVRRDLRNGS